MLVGFYIFLVLLSFVWDFVGHMFRNIASMHVHLFSSCRRSWLASTNLVLLYFKASLPYSVPMHDSYRSIKLYWVEYFFFTKLFNILSFVYQRNGIIVLCSITSNKLVKYKKKNSLFSTYSTLLDIQICFNIFYWIFNF